jgi:hypothetical protein
MFAPDASWDGRFGEEADIRNSILHGSFVRFAAIRTNKRFPRTVKSRLVAILDRIMRLEDIGFEWPRRGSDKGEE